MQTVQDKDGMPWEIDLTIDAYRRIKRDCKIDLGMARYPGPSGLPLSAELFESPTLLLDVLWSICQPQTQTRAAARGINKDAFDAKFFGPALETAKTALFEEWQVFFQNLGRPTDSEMILNVMKFLPQEAEEQVSKQREMIGATSTNSSSNTPALPAANPDTSLSAS